MRHVGATQRDSDHSSMPQFPILSSLREKLRELGKLTYLKHLAQSVAHSET